MLLSSSSSYFDGCRLQLTFHHFGKLFDLDAVGIHVLCGVVPSYERERKGFLLYYLSIDPSVRLSASSLPQSFAELEVICSGGS